ncbi:hypothetical protein OGAPHI_003584 [Ogataea philodendri]|uniref:PX domain-containing protein n=1 Tax=Ogataea philodendri TaxID=1378263 RepID=A0A9P8P537_9ASCO|nr:uncharacterized protein OGAPHI_003584 [Ogataea philodendri]KAH3665400.1 hypothetical protein OGAPHI_003584 [Ogataea philodendri]
MFFGLNSRTSKNSKSLCDPTSCCFVSINKLTYLWVKEEVPNKDECLSSSVSNRRYSTFETLHNSLKIDLSRIMIDFKRDFSDAIEPSSSLDPRDIDLVSKPSKKCVILLSPGFEAGMF